MAYSGVSGVSRMAGRRGCVSCACCICIALHTSTLVAKVDPAAAKCTNHVNVDNSLLHPLLCPAFGKLATESATPSRAMTSYSVAGAFCAEGQSASLCRFCASPLLIQGRGSRRPGMPLHDAANSQCATHVVETRQNAHTWMPSPRPSKRLRRASHMQRDEAHRPACIPKSQGCP
eukprot:208384-Chlamydomonas_euryale.AAC.2